MPPPGLHAHAAGVIMRSLLFVPGDSPKKLDKALGCGADALIVDLEDSVSTVRKREARAIALAFLTEARKAKTRLRLLVRINGLATGLADDDLEVMAASPDAIMLPKAEGGASIAHLDAKMTVREALHGLPDGETRIVALATETAKAMFVAGTIAGASQRLSGLTWGAEDLSAELGAESNRDADGRFTEPYQLARSLCLVAAAASGVQAIDTVYVDFRNGDGLRHEAEKARRDGFTGKLAIHPSQVEIINDVFTPSTEQIAHARAIAAAFAAEPGAGVVGIAGVMYDRPHLVRAQRLLERSRAASAE